jgi:hypothetical protein
MERTYQDLIIENQQLKEDIVILKAIIESYEREIENESNNKNTNKPVDDIKTI